MRETHEDEDEKRRRKGVGGRLDGKKDHWCGFAMLGVAVAVDPER